MTPEEIEELRAMVTRLGANAYDENLAAILGAALEHIDQQAASLAATEERVREHEAHENRTHEVLGKILGTDDTLENVAQRAVNRIAELEARCIYDPETGKIFVPDGHPELERLRSQVAALQEIAITEKAYHIYYRCQGDCGRCVCSAGVHKKDARDQLAKEHPEVDWK